VSGFCASELIPIPDDCSNLEQGRKNFLSAILTTLRFSVAEKRYLFVKNLIAVADLIVK